MSKPHRRNLSLLSALSLINLRGSSSANSQVPQPQTPNPQPFPSIVHSPSSIQNVYDTGTGDQTPQVAQNNQVTKQTIKYGPDGIGKTYIHDIKTTPSGHASHTVDTPISQPTRSKRPTKHQLQQFLYETRRQRQEQQRRGRKRSQREILQSKMHNARVLAENNQETLLEYVDEITHDTN